MSNLLHLLSELWMVIEGVKLKLDLNQRLSEVGERWRASVWKTDGPPVAIPDGNRAMEANNREVSFSFI